MAYEGLSPCFRSPILNVSLQCRFVPKNLVLCLICVLSHHPVQYSAIIAVERFTEEIFPNRDRGVNVGGSEWTEQSSRLTRRPV